MANPCEQYCADVVAALLADYNTNPECPVVFEVRDDLGPTRMAAVDLSLTVSTEGFRTWSDGGMNSETPIEEDVVPLPSIRGTVTFSLLVIYHGVSAADHGEGWWNAQGLVAGLASWLTWRRVGQSHRIIEDVEVRKHYERDGTHSGWLLLWQDEIGLDARFEYHCRDVPAGVVLIGPEPSTDLSEVITGQMLTGNLTPSDSPEFDEVSGGN